MRTNRHAKILELIEREKITTQEELMQRLKEEGIPVTQATISRDIKHLRLMKALDKDGVYRYESPKASRLGNVSDKFFSIFKETVMSVDMAGNIVCIRCYTGMANAACAALDSMEFENVVGTISGDDTVFVLMRSPGDASRMKETMLGFFSK
ncbi:MAG: arginine repressor [Oscillospiraceae bacterium]|jgi:transcriptional regulator of arginine metabolism|nr:arginine repressor [Oscillospiraceae bacterium]